MISREELAEIDPELLLADGYDHCILGVAHRFSEPDVVAYDIGCIVGSLVENDGMMPDEAIEYFEYNILGSYVGERTPTFIETFKTEGSDNG